MIVTVPVLVTSPAAMVSVLAALSVKSPATAFIPGMADTVTVVATIAGCESVAVTAADPGFVPSCSSMRDGVSASVTAGAASLSFSVSAAPVTASSAPTSFATVAVTVTIRPALPW